MIFGLTCLLKSKVIDDGLMMYGVMYFVIPAFCAICFVVLLMNPPNGFGTLPLYVPFGMMIRYSSYSGFGSRRADSSGLLQLTLG